MISDEEFAQCVRMLALAKLRVHKADLLAQKRALQYDDKMRVLNYEQAQRFLENTAEFCAWCDTADLDHNVVRAWMTNNKRDYLRLGGL